MNKLSLLILVFVMTLNLQARVPVAAVETFLKANPEITKAVTEIAILNGWITKGTKGAAAIKALSSSAKFAEYITQTPGIAVTEKGITFKRTTASSGTPGTEARHALSRNLMEVASKVDEGFEEACYTGTKLENPTLNAARDALWAMNQGTKTPIPSKEVEINQIAKLKAQLFELTTDQNGKPLTKLSKTVENKIKRIQAALKGKKVTPAKNQDLYLNLFNNLMINASGNKIAGKFALQRFVNRLRVMIKNGDIQKNPELLKFCSDNKIPLKNPEATLKAILAGFGKNFLEFMGISEENGIPSTEKTWSLIRYYKQQPATKQLMTNVEAFLKVPNKLNNEKLPQTAYCAFGRI